MGKHEFAAGLSIETAVENLYQQFKHYSLKFEPMTASWTRDDPAIRALEDRVKHQGRRKIECADMMTIMLEGTASDESLKYFLPRGCECLKQHDQWPAPNWDYMYARLTSEFIHFSSWPECEQDALLEFLVLYWLEALRRTPTIELDRRTSGTDRRLLLSIGEIVGDGSALIQKLECIAELDLAAGALAARGVLAYLIKPPSASPLRSANEPNRAQKISEQFTRWLCQPSLVAKFEDAYLRQSDSTDAELFKEVADGIFSLTSGAPT